MNDQASHVTLEMIKVRVKWADWWNSDLKWFDVSSNEEWTGDDDVESQICFRKEKNLNEMSCVGLFF